MGTIAQKDVQVKVEGEEDVAVHHQPASHSSLSITPPTSAWQCEVLPDA